MGLDAEPEELSFTLVSPPGFYPIAAGDLAHAALVLEEEPVNGAKFQVRLIGQKGGRGKITITVIVCDDRSTRSLVEVARLASNVYSWL